MKKNRILLAMFVFVLSGNVSAGVALDTIFNLHAGEAIEIDGQADETCWGDATWNAIDEVWIPWGTSIGASDFDGRFKVVWDADYLYMLVEIQDNMLSDDHSDPLQNWWDDDCLEIFIDEDRSMGDHERNTNAFAYHISLFYDAIDLNSSGNGINYKEHIEVDMDTIGENLYQWEIAFKIYDDTYNHSSQEDSRVRLTSEKVMGLTVAYCDNDETSSRETFIGSVYMPQSNYNDSYKNADYFGVMKLKSGGVGVEAVKVEDCFSVYPNPSKGMFQLRSDLPVLGEVKVYSASGAIVYSSHISESNGVINLGDVSEGVYFLRVGDRIQKILVY